MSGKEKRPKRDPLGETYSRKLDFEDEELKILKTQQFKQLPWEEREMIVTTERKYKDKSRERNNEDKSVEFDIVFNSDTPEFVKR